MCLGGSFLRVCVCVSPFSRTNVNSSSRSSCPTTARNVRLARKTESQYERPSLALIEREHFDAVWLSYGYQSLFCLFFHHFHREAGENTMKNIQSVVFFRGLPPIPLPLLPASARSLSRSRPVTFVQPMCRHAHRCQQPTIQSPKEKVRETTRMKRKRARIV